MGKLVVATLHKQAEEALIALMKNTSDNRLVSEEDLAAMLGVSRTTVREAMNSLMRRGALTKRKGKGNFFLKSVMDTHMRIDFLHEYPQNFYYGYDGESKQRELYPCTFSLKALVA